MWKFSALKRRLGMGGANETTAPLKDSAGSVIGKVRYHLSGDEVHFHEDAANKKVAVPVADWFAAFQELSEGTKEEWSFLDKKSMTYLTVKTAIVPSTDTEPAKLDVVLNIGDIQVTSDFEALKKFTTQPAT